MVTDEWLEEESKMCKAKQAVKSMHKMSNDPPASDLVSEKGTGVVTKPEARIDDNYMIEYDDDVVRAEGVLPGRGIGSARIYNNYVIVYDTKNNELFRKRGKEFGIISDRAIRITDFDNTTKIFTDDGGTVLGPLYGEW